MRCLQRKQALFFSTLLYTVIITLTLISLLYNNGYFRQVLFKQQSEGHSIIPSLQNEVDFTETAKRKVLSYDHHSRSRKGYVLALTYSGQQGSGIEAIRSLQCWASSLSVPTNILEPIMSKSRLVTDLPQVNVPSSENQLTFSDFFNLEYFNSIAEKEGLAKLTTKENFFENAPKKVILVRMDWIDRTVPNEQRHTKILWPKTTSKSQACFSSEDEVTANISRHTGITQILNKGYCIVKLISSPHSPARTRIFSQKDVRDTIYGNWEPNEVTVVFTLWRAIWRVPVNNNDTRNTGHSCSKINPFTPSKRTNREANWYENEFLERKNTLTIMFRLERMVEYFHQKYRHRPVGKNVIGHEVDKCLSKVIAVSKSIQRKENIHRKPFVTLDLGKFGSTSWEQTFSNIGENKTELEIKAKQTLSVLFNNKWSFGEWENSFTKATKGVDNSGYIAALQRTLASRADCLVLVGGGSFQIIALKDYLHEHPDKDSRCIHLVCIRDEPMTRDLIANYGN